MLNFLRKLFHHKKISDMQVRISCDTSEFKKQMAGLRAEIKLTKEAMAPTIVRCGRHSTLLVRYHGELSAEAKDRLEKMCEAKTGLACFAVPDTVDLSIFSR